MGCIQVRGQIDILLEACSGRSSPGFVAAAWEAVIRRLEQMEPLAFAAESCSMSHLMPTQQHGTGRGGVEETKGKHAAERSNDETPGKGLAKKTEDVALAASSDQQLRVAGTFRRAIRASVSYHSLQHVSTLLRINTLQVFSI